MTPPSSSILMDSISPAAGPVRRLPIGAEPLSDGGVHFRVWAPRCREVAVEIESLGSAELQAEADGYFSLRSLSAKAGMRYRFRLDPCEAALPDPASRFQPEGPHGPSEIVDPGDFAWNDQMWRGRTREQLVIYEMHVGTFTPEGSWAAAARELAVLAELGITCLEIMPVAEFAGRFGWGYDGVDLFARPAFMADRMIFATLSTAPTLSGSRLFLMLSTTMSARTETTLNHSPQLILPIATTTSGAKRSISMARIRGRRANFSSPMPATGSTSITSMGCGWTRRSRSSIDRTIILSPPSFDRCDRRVAGEQPSWSARTSRSRRDWCVRLSAAAMGSIHCGTTTSTTAPWSL
jgi:hypothetical protein